MASVQMTGVRKSFGAVDVIHSLDLKIEDGAFVALVGPSGCGKSTLLRMIAGLEETTGGEISIGNRVVNELTPRERNIAMVFQNYALYPHMTVAENMGFNLKLAKKSQAEIETRVAEAARMLGLTPLLDRRPSQLSGGQRQRVAMGRAVVRNPQVFLFDEPLSNLDAKLRVQMRTEIKALHQKVRTTSVYVTHDQIEAMTLADHIVVMHGGRIEQQGHPMELYRKPANLFVAGFIGTPAMNFVEAVGGSDDRGPLARLSGGEAIRVDGVRLEEGRPVTLGFRPEHLTARGSGTRLTGPARFVEPTGALTHVTFDVGGRDIVAVVDGENQVTAGEAFEATVPADLVHVFDRQSGARLNAL
ncbi:ABC transporter ATP-binding protein [Rhizobium sp. SSA_523]|uniref:ABC transporter ATP-binding protein n=1 Tax=Rhizobium sp. SSA_523 TaxID=2952477 RepID=UPI002090A82C|nr:sn-glycerol-3-phosphate ABC transporter ATP-binding protein UgpC [Rhizobium sp. SSA_523]MCO5731522.1 sn-glycerol-3-phosphate ABC transporter ATP-binding protein UgpC [Rhizobium sp. SSA_523]WKC21962.1 sn-glycerol-3-phosphate ABC transporter ATP-binding protein UgpC [Rhizobium sp. SSA_523]